MAPSEASGACVQSYIALQVILCLALSAYDYTHIAAERVYSILWHFYHVNFYCRLMFYKTPEGLVAAVLFVRWTIVFDILIDTVFILLFF